MSVDNVHGLYSVVLDTDVLGGITQLSAPSGTEVRGEPTSGEVFNLFQSVTAQNPSVSFTTLNIAAALDLCALTGLDIDSLAAGMSLYQQKHADGSTRAGTLSHRKLTITDGILVPRTLSCEHQGDAALGYEALITYDGSNDPIVPTESQTLPATTDAERFTLGGITIESVGVSAVKSFELDFGIDVQVEGGDSDIWPTYVSIRQIAPSITIRGIDVELFKAANIPLIGKAVTHANTTIYLRKRAAGSTFVADATEEHIALTAAGTAYLDPIMDASGSDPAEVTLMLPLKYDGTNDPVEIDTTAAIV